MKIVALAFLVLILVVPQVTAHPINMEALAKIESSGDPNAINKSSKAIGLYQITPTVRKHYNKFHNTFISEEDLYYPEINKMVADWYLHWLWTLVDTERNILICYNWGIGNYRKWDKRLESLPKETKDYLFKYEALTGEEL